MRRLSRHVCSENVVLIFLAKKAEFWAQLLLFQRKGRFDLISMKDGKYKIMYAFQLNLNSTTFIDEGLSILWKPNRATVLFFPLISCRATEKFLGINIHFCLPKWFKLISYVMLMAFMVNQIICQIHFQSLCLLLSTFLFYLIQVNFHFPKCIVKFNFPWNTCINNHWMGLLWYPE